MKNDLELRLGEDLKQAMRAKDPIALDTIRSVRGAIQSRELEAGAALAEADVIKLIRGLVKQRDESIAQYKEGGRADLVERETAEKAILESYLPTAPSAADVDRVVAEVVVELQATSLKDMGKVMKAALERLGPAVDGKLVSAAVKARLSP
jgi:uncharacterized protein